jgi:transcriptional regulator with XRE-family HTH domain
MALESRSSPGWVDSRFGIVTRRLRQERGWSQEKLAELADLNRSYLGEIERGDAKPSIGSAEKIALAFDLRLSSLVGLCEHENGGLLAIAG